MTRLNFQLEKVAKNSHARAARYRTLHNEVLTPIFMPVGTHATVRSQTQESLEIAGATVLLANTYHLLLRPGPEIFKKFKGIHNFMQWPRSVLTDSGGFQIFAMPKDRAISEEGAKFLSYVDGAHVFLSPEKSIETQKAIGSDIMMVLDQCVPSTVSHDEARLAMELSNRWALRSLAARAESTQSLFAIIQGACYPDLRKRAAEFLSQHPFDGFALGGLAVGESKQEREDTVQFAANLLPEDRPRYLMGVGTPIDLLEAVHRGMDMFDCIIPTAHAEQGVAYTWMGKILLRRGVYKDSLEPIDAKCECATCRKFSRAYLFHLIKTREHYGRQLIAQHNIYFYLELVRKMRAEILADTFYEFYLRAREDLVAEDPEFPMQKAKPKKTRIETLGDYEIFPLPDGSANIKNTSSGEIMHSQIRADLEAKSVYFDQSGIEKLAASASGEIVLWDVGMGAAANSMTTLLQYEKLFTANPQTRPLKIFSFENDLDSLRLASHHQDRFHYLRHSAPSALLQAGNFVSKKYPVEWKLFQGNFEDTLSLAPCADVIYFDPFSFKTNREMWSVENLKKVYALCKPNARLITFSPATAVRTTLLAAGFQVAKGIGVGPQGESSIAVKGIAEENPDLKFLDAEWLQRWERSDSKSPIEKQASNADWFTLIRQHPQFAKATETRL